jgi:hypothetical protein
VAAASDGARRRPRAPDRARPGRRRRRARRRSDLGLGPALAPLLELAQHTCGRCGRRRTPDLDDDLVGRRHRLLDLAEDEPPPAIGLLRSTRHARTRVSFRDPSQQSRPGNSAAIARTTAAKSAVVPNVVARSATSGTCCRNRSKAVGESSARPSRSSPRFESSLVLGAIHQAVSSADFHVAESAIPVAAQFSRAPPTSPARLYATTAMREESVLLRVTRPTSSATGKIAAKAAVVVSAHEEAPSRKWPDRSPSSARTRRRSPPSRAAR